MDWYGPPVVTVDLHLVKMAGRIGRAAINSSGFFLCDMQEQFRKTISYYPQVIEVARRMLVGAKTLDMPIFVTEQYPKGQCMCIIAQIPYLSFTFDWH